jgi:hypothetical protein
MTEVVREVLPSGSIQSKFTTWSPRRRCWVTIGMIWNRPHKPGQKVGHIIMVTGWEE